MNRKIRRELIKNKNLLNELYRIIVKYFPKLFDMFEDLTDVRHQSYVTYNMKTICITRLFSLLSGIQTMTDISSDIFNTESSIKNIAKISGQKLKEIPYWETIQDVFVNININELRNIQKYIVQTLIRSKMFDKYRHNGSFLIVFDGTGLSCHNYNLNGNCLTRKHKSGQITYHRYVPSVSL